MKIYKAKNEAKNVNPREPAAPGRLYFIDNLRAWLTIIVVLHHISVIYTASTAYYYLEAPGDAPASFLLIFFQMCDQAYFMGLFFFLSGLFTPASYDRRGVKKFVADRLLRLGLPLLAYVVLLNPITCIPLYQMPRSLGGLEGPFAWRMGPGPLWFIVMLLVFDAAYALWRIAARNRRARPARAYPPLKPRDICLFTLGLAAAGYFTRIFIPFGRYFLFFPTLAYLPQYVSFFALGLLALRRGWLFTIPDRYGKRGLIAAAASVALYLLAVIPEFVRSGGAGADAYTGRGTWESGVFALWDSVFSVGISLALIVYFRRYLNRQHAWGKLLQKNSYTVFVIHSPVIVLTAAYVLRGVRAYTPLKFGLAAVICVPLCYAAAWLIRKIPKAVLLLTDGRARK